LISTLALFIILGCFGFGWPTLLCSFFVNLRRLSIGISLRFLIVSSVIEAAISRLNYRIIQYFLCLTLEQVF
jgi:hypothetical protein